MTEDMGVVFRNALSLQVFAIDRLAQGDNAGTLWEQRSMTHRALAVGPGTPAKPGETRTFERIQVLSRPFRTKTSRLEAEPLV